VLGGCGSSAACAPAGCGAFFNNCGGCLTDCGLVGPTT
jgi:hypothetical protein